MTSHIYKNLLLVILVGFSGGLWSRSLSAQNIELEIKDRDSGSGVPARVRFTKGEKQAGLPRNLLKVGKWTLAEANVPIAPKPGEFEFLAQRGHEFTEIRGGFTIEKGARDIVTVEIPSSTSMREEGWYSGDHLSSLPNELLKRWQEADAVDMVVARRIAESETQDAKAKAPSKPKRKAKEESNIELASEKELGMKLSTESYPWQTTGGSILFHPSNMTDNLSLREDASLPQLMEVLNDYDRVKDFVPEIEQLWARDVPILLSSSRIKAAQVLNSANTPDGDAKLDFKPNQSPQSPIRLAGKMIKKGTADQVFAPIEEEDSIRYRNGRGLGLLSEKILWTILETGLRITPTASSGFGDGESHLGYNRTYAHCDSDLDQKLYWESVALGKTMVTNGPLLRVSINEQWPGSTLSSQAGEPIELNIAASLSVRDPVDYLDVIFNGDTIYSAKLEDHYRKGEFPPISIDKSGWLVVRVVTSHDHLYRYATTAPFYFEFDGKSRISTKSVEFMINWLKRSVDSISKATDTDSTMKSTLESAEAFWQNRLEQANAP
ncbi:MAG: hypothetical protein MUC83_16825 [Pirellula sp.]|jgi:hypothetical protein|nr:hypothetical protein [Pirellula sp.]